MSEEATADAVATCAALRAQSSEPGPVANVSGFFLDILITNLFGSTRIGTLDIRHDPGRQYDANVRTYDRSREIRNWATFKRAIPTEMLPHIVDGEPATLRLMLAEHVANHANIRVLSWEEFFIKFDSLGLTFVYDDDPTGRNEILQIEENSPYRRFKDRSQTLEN